MVAVGKAAAAAALSGRHVKDLWAWPGQTQWTSPLGTPDWQHLPPFMTNNPLPQGFPWAGRTAKNTNYYQDTPNTGVTRHYDWTVSRVDCNPDGLFENQCLLVNNQFPGPTIEANWGDWIEVTVTNNIPDEGTSIHWHGLLQTATPFMDGVPGNTQCPIAPGASFTYRFQADLYGTSWWHSHWSAQYGSGLYGAIVIYGPQNVEYDSDIGPILLSDYYHEYYTAAVEKTLANPASGEAGPPLADNNLINGKASDGPAPMASFNVTSGKTYRLRLINTSAASVQKFTIDGYNMTIFANDFVPIVPYETDVVTLAIGQRSDILFKATGKPTDAVWMRSFRPPPCGPSNGGEEVTAAIFYEDADRSQLPTTSPGPNAYNSYCGNDPLSQTVPYYPLAPGDASTTERIPIQFNDNGTALLWYLANRTFRIDYNDPILLESKLGNLDFPYIRNVHNYGTNQSVRFIIENPGDQPHPMHLHGHNIFVLQEGSCTGNGGIEVGGAPGGPSAGSSTSPAPAPTGSNPTTIATYSITSSLPSETTTPTSAPASGASGYTTSSSPGGYTTSSTPGGYTTSSSTAAGYTTSSISATSSSSSSSSAPAPPGYGSSTSSAAAPSGTYGLKIRQAESDNPNGCWDGTIVNPNNPQRRDVHMLLPGQYIVIQWTQDNPGVWPLHCHIAWHLSSGFAWMVLENPDAIQNEMQIPSVMAQTCREWAAYTNQNVVEQIDDGI